MKRNTVVTILILLLFTFNQLFAQIKTNNYIIITQENEYSNGLEGIIRKYWIIPEDSLIKADTIKFSPLILNYYFKEHIDSCIKGINIDPLNNTSMDPVSIDSLQKSARKNLFLLERENRKKVQTVEKRWPTGYWSTTTYYATPITGNFCTCRLGKGMELSSKYKGAIFMVNDYITSYNNFWNTPKATIIITNDFSLFNFDYNTMLNVFKNGKKYEK